MDPSGGGGGGDFDPCECVWSHELATRRLIDLIRSNQDDCTDSQCFGEGPGGLGADGGTTGVFFIGLWFLIALVLFFLRPRAALPTDKSRDALGPNYDPPAPPSAL